MGSQYAPANCDAYLTESIFQIRFAGVVKII